MYKQFKKTILSTFLLVVSLAAVASPVHAGFGISPTHLSHENLSPGGAFEKSITISRADPTGSLEILIEPSLDEMEKWFTFEPGMKFIFPDGQKSFKINAIVNVPKDAPIKHYEGLIRVKARPAEGSASGVSVIQGSRVEVNLVVTDAKVVSLVAKRLKMRDVTGNENLKMDMDVTNNGTTPASPTVKLKILNLQQEELENLEATDLPAVEANETKSMTAEFESGIGDGEYFAIAQVMYEDQLIREERLVFRASNRTAGFVGQTEETAEQPKSGGANFAGLITIENVAIVGFLLALLIVGYLAFFKRKGAADSDSEEKGKKAGKKTKKSSPRQKYALYSGFLVAIFSSLLLWRNSQLLLGSKPTVEAPEAEVASEPSESPESQEPTPTPPIAELIITDDATQDGATQSAGLVQGVTDTVDLGQAEIKKTENPQPLIVTNESDKSGFLVYQDQDTSSKVLYEAEDGESFNVLEENSRWYRILLPTGTDGWLLKSSVKSVQPVQE